MTFHLVLVGVVLIISALGIGILAWNLLPADAVGRFQDAGRRKGLQGGLASWLGAAAPLTPPGPAADAVAGPREPPARRAFLAVLREEAVRRGTSVDEAHDSLRSRVDDPVAAAFLAGRMGRAARLMARRAYSGRPGLFPLWYVLVARVRYGRRRLFLEALTHTLQEIRRP